MHPRAQATLAKLNEVQWFRNAGVRDTSAAEILTSWDEAMESCSSSNWKELRAEAANQYRERLAECCRERLAGWNEIVRAIKPSVEAIVEEQTRAVVAQFSLPQDFINAVRWDVLHLCMEAEYFDVYPPGFFTSQAYWYVQGHFPCGWKGKCPEGTLVIY